MKSRSGAHTPTRSTRDWAGFRWSYSLIEKEPRASSCFHSCVVRACYLQIVPWLKPSPCTGLRPPRIGSVRDEISPLRTLLLSVSAWVNRHQADAIAYLNAYAELLVLTIKSKCLGRMIFLGEGSLKRAALEFGSHYNEQRPHQGVGNKLIAGRAVVGDAEVDCAERLGGLLKSYSHAA
jgi:hypothetical protein